MTELSAKLLDVVHYLKQEVYFMWHTRGVQFYIAVLCILIMLGAGTYALVATRALESQKELNCLALNIYHEARGEPEIGQLAVGEVTINRVSSKHFPGTICGVVYQTHWDKRRKKAISAFSWTTEEGSSKPEYEAWQKAKHAAKKILSDDYRPVTKGALFYHATYISKPYWARSMRVKARIGEHIFY